MDLDQYNIEYETDQVSLTSTVEEEDVDGKDYDVEAILSESTGDTGKMYLIKWAGYPIDQ